MIFMLWTIATKSTSKYEVVSWNEKVTLWRAEFYFNGKKSKYYFDTEGDAAEARYEVHEQMGILPQSSRINNEIPNRPKKMNASQYKGVYYHNQTDKWYARLYLRVGKNKYGGYFNNELDAAQRVNQLCEELKIRLKNPGITGMPNQQGKHKASLKHKVSQYNGVCWHKENKKWSVQIHKQGGKRRYGGMFDDELDAAKRANQLCEEMGIPHKNHGISAIPNQQCHAREKTSQYIDVHWYKQRHKWAVQLNLKGGKKMYGGLFTDELDAAKRVNQLCEKMGIPHKNPEISAIPIQQHKPKKTSQYKEVHWYKQRDKWFAQLHLPGRQTKFGGYFNDEMDAAKKVNQLCEEIGIPHKNHGIGTITNQLPKQKTSQYVGVYWHKQRDKWFVQLRFQGGIRKSRTFNDELDAAKRVNQLCEEMAIPHKNSGISAIPNQQYHARKTTSQYYGVYWNKQKDKWCGEIRFLGKKKYARCFEDKLDAAKSLNQLCEEFQIPHKNPGIGTIPNQKPKHTASKYKGVHRHNKSKKWCARLNLPGGKKRYGGIFNDELDAAKRTNQLCEAMEIPHKNPGISSMPSEQYQAKEKTSNILEFTGTMKTTNGVLKFAYTEKKSLVDVSTMKLMQQKKLTNFVKIWEFLTKILKLVRYQFSNIYTIKSSIQKE